MILDPDQILAQSALFEGFSATERGDVAAILRPVDYDEGAVIFREGDIGDSMLLIAEGQLRLGKRVAGGGEIPLATLGVGALTGEMSLMDGSPRSATAVAHTAVRGFLASRKAFDSRRVAGVAGIRKLMRRIAIRASENLLAMSDRSVDIAPAENADAVFAQGRPACLPEASILAGLPLIGGSTAEELAPLFAGAMEYSLQPGDALAPVSGRIGNMYLLLYGAIETRLARAGGADVVEVLAPGSLIGACGALTEQPAPTTQVAREPSTVVEFPLQQVRQWLQGDEPTNALFQDLICRQAFYDLRSANRRLAWLKAIDAGFIQP